jgi:hypothetical protein
VTIQGGGYYDNANPVKGGGLSTEHATAALVIGCLAALFLIRRGFRGVNVGGVSVGVR